MNSVSIASRVVPLTGLTIVLFSPTKAFKMLLLPTLGRPTIAIAGTLFYSSTRASESCRQLTISSYIPSFGLKVNWESMTFWHNRDIEWPKKTHYLAKNAVYKTKLPHDSGKKL